MTASSCANWGQTCHRADPDEAVQASGVTVATWFQEMVLVASVPPTGELAEGELVTVTGGRVSSG